MEDRLVLVWVLLVLMKTAIPEKNIGKMSNIGEHRSIFIVTSRLLCRLGTVCSECIISGVI